LETVAPALGTSAWQMVAWGFFVSTTILFHVTSLVNSAGHLTGSRRYATKDHSRNSLWLALLTFGEGWHNNHHHYPVSARQGFYWWEVDLSYYILRVMQMFRLVSDLRPVPAETRAMTADAVELDPEGNS
jgi:stearoyl-CoA desaturase (delta-9 desaturase)